MHGSTFFYHFLFVFSASAKPVLEFEHLDQFGFKSNLHRNGSRYNVDCSCDSSTYANLTCEGKTVEMQTCVNNTAHFRLDINEKTAFGKYTCKNDKGEATSDLFVRYVLCADTSADCTDKFQQCPSKFCVVKNQNGSADVCDKLEPSSCIREPGDSRFCPSKKSIQCEIFDQYDEATALYTARGACDKKANMVAFKFDGEFVSYDDIIRLGKPSNLTVAAWDSEYARKGQMECEIRNQMGDIVQEMNDTYNTRTELHLAAHLFSNGSQLQKVQCTLTDSTGSNTVLLQMRFVVFATTLTIERTFEKELTLSCLPTQKLPPGFRIEKYSWTDKTGTEISNQPNLTIKNPGGYKCQATLVFLTCSPYKKFTTQMTTQETISKEDLSKKISPLPKVTPISVMTSEPANETTASGNDPAAKSGPPIGLIVGIILTALFVLVAGGLAAWFFYTKKKKKREREVVLNQPLLNSQDAYRMKDYVMLQKRNDELRAAVTRRDMGKVMLYEFNDAGLAIDKEANKKDLVFLPIFLHNEDISVRYDTQVVMKKGKDEDEKYPLSMNKMLDLYSKPILISESPIMESFALHWEAIWQEKVGVIVWVGEIGPGKMTTPVHPTPKYIQEYAPTQQGGKMTCGDEYIIKTTWADKPKNGMCSKYDLRVTNTNNIETRHISLFHIKQSDRNTSRYPLELADVIGLIEKRHGVQMSAGLPATLIHCLDGIHRSPSVVAIYLCKQLLRQNRMVDVQGVMGYVRTHRYKAWSVDPLLLFNQFKLIYGAVEVLASRFKTSRANAVDNGTVREESRIYGGRHKDKSQKSRVQKTFIV